MKAGKDAICGLSGHKLLFWSTDTPCTGDEAAERARACCAGVGRRVSEPLRRDNYRIDRIG